MQGSCMIGAGPVSERRGACRSVDLFARASRGVTRQWPLALSPVKCLRTNAAKPAWPVDWALPAPMATASRAKAGSWEEDDIDWGQPSKEELVLDARLAGRDPVPSWARSMTIRGNEKSRFVRVHSYKGKDLPTYLVQDAFDLTKANMEAMYEQSLWGWSDGQKRGDLESELARFFVATDERGQLQGFIHYRFEVIDNKFTHDTSCAAYVLELQVDDGARRLGLGSLLMKAVEEISLRRKMDSTMLCVFRYNEPAVHFYLNKLGYFVDGSSAFNENQTHVWELIKPNPTPSPPPPSDQHTAHPRAGKNTHATHPRSGKKGAESGSQTVLR